MGDNANAFVVGFRVWEPKTGAQAAFPKVADESPSKNRVTDETLALLVQLAEQSGLRERIDAMFRGERDDLGGFW